MNKTTSRLTAALSNGFLIAMVPLMAISGCASHSDNRSRHRQPPSETFSTEITEDGTKLFTYRLERPERSQVRDDSIKKRARREGGKSGQPPASREQRNDKMKTRMQQKLAAKIDETGFCNEGYIILDEYIGKDGFSIRGECREGASENGGTTPENPEK